MTARTMTARTMTARTMTARTRSNTVPQGPGVIQFRKDKE